MTPRPSAPWTPERGFQLGLRRLRQILRDMKGSMIDDDGEGKGLRLFVDLVRDQKLDIGKEK